MSGKPEPVDVQLCLPGEGKREVVQRSMDIKFTHRLSYKQARLTVLVGFVLGTLLSLIQIGIDYASEDASINREIRSLLKSATTPRHASPTTSTPNWLRN
jgi:hypothetical protein